MTHDERRTSWTLAVASADTSTLRSWAGRPAGSFPYGVKADIKRELRLRDRASACQKCHRTVAATLFGYCGACLRLRPADEDEPAQMRCAQCGALTSTALLTGRRCPTCHLAAVGEDPRFVRAGEDLPLREVFTRQEMRRLAFVKRLVASGKLREGDTCTQP